MNDQTKTLLLYGLLAYAGLSMLGGSKAKTEATQPTGPSAEMRALVAPMGALRAKNVEAAAKMAAFYKAAADVVRRDDGGIKTTGQFRAANVRANELYILKTPIAGSLGIGPSFDNAVMQAIGAEDVALDATKRARLAELLDAMAWALEGGE